MINPKELRIGNWVETAGNYVQICEDDFKDTTHLFAIPLTEEWLVKLGFDSFYLSDTKIKHVHQLQNL